MQEVLLLVRELLPGCGLAHSGTEYRMFHNAGETWVDYSRDTPANLIAKSLLYGYARCIHAPRTFLRQIDEVCRAQ